MPQFSDAHLPIDPELVTEPLLDTEPESAHKSKHAWSAQFRHWQRAFWRLPEWKQMAVVGGAILVFLILGGGVWAAAGKLGSQPAPKQTATTSSSPTPKPSATPTATPEPMASATPSPSPSSTPKPTTSPTPKPSTSPTPTPSPTSTTNKTYVLNWSEGSVTTKVHQPNESYAVYALLKYDGATVTDQKNVKYTWTVADSSIADITPFAACIDGIKEPCPEDHARIKGKKEGSTTVTAKATWKDTGAFIDDVTIQLKISGVSVAPTAQPSPTPSSPPEMRISYPTTGQAVPTSPSGTICMVDAPVSNTQGLQMKHNLNSQGWTSYQNIYTLCYQPPVGSNSIQVQYKNSANLESVVYSIQFTYGQ